MNTQISYCGDLPRPWYVFQPDGGTTFFGPETFGGWVGASIPTGKELGTYATYCAAREAHPRAWLTHTAKAALNAGCH